ncbi:MAG TPA: hypothetical protein VEE84_06250, partial [Burkholderiaceae bacterium]|nr:hypothetical protein [Burkholderiaceae bacterium]
MLPTLSAIDFDGRLSACGFAGSQLRTLSDARSAIDLAVTKDNFEAEATSIGQFCGCARALLDGLPQRSRRSPEEKLAGESIVQAMADYCWRFFGTRRHQIYERLTDAGRRALRLEQLASDGAALLPGILPDASELADEGNRLLKDKDGRELHQALFFAQLLSDRTIGLHLCAAMLRPTQA